MGGARSNYGNRGHSSSRNWRATPWRRRLRTRSISRVRFAHRRYSRRWNRLLRPVPLDRQSPTCRYISRRRVCFAIWGDEISVRASTWMSGIPTSARIQLDFERIDYVLTRIYRDWSDNAARAYRVSHNVDDNDCRPAIIIQALGPSLGSSPSFAVAVALRFLSPLHLLCRWGLGGRLPLRPDSSLADRKAPMPRSTGRSARLHPTPVPRRHDCAATLATS